MSYLSTKPVAVRRIETGSRKLVLNSVGAPEMTIRPAVVPVAVSMIMDRRRNVVDERSTGSDVTAAILIGSWYHVAGSLTARQPALTEVVRLTSGLVYAVLEDDQCACHGAHRK